MRRLSLTLFLFLLLVKFGAAAELEISLIQYDTDLQIARIQLANLGEIAYHNLSVSIDNGPFISAVGKLNPKTANVITRTIGPENHIITVSTIEKVFSKELSFAKSNDTIKEELKKIEEEKRQLAESRLMQKKEKPLFTRTAKQAMLLVAFLFIAFLSILLIRRARKQKTAQPKMAQKAIRNMQSRQINPQQVQASHMPMWRKPRERPTVKKPILKPATKPVAPTPSKSAIAQKKQYEALSVKKQELPKQAEEIREKKESLFDKLAAIKPNIQNSKDINKKTSQEELPKEPANKESSNAFKQPEVAGKKEKRDIFYELSKIKKS